MSNFDPHFLFNFSNNTDDPYSDLQNKSLSYIPMIFGSLFSLTFIFGIFTNFLVVIVFIFKSELRQYTNYFFANLSIADILVLIVCIPVALSDCFSPDIWPLGGFYCRMYYFIESCVTSVSSLTIILISLERFFAISKPLSVKLLFNEKNSIFIIILIWLMGILISVPFLLMVTYTEQPAQCQLDMTMVHIVYVFIMNILIIFIPTFGLTFLYIYIIIKLRKHSRLFNRTRSSSMKDDDARMRVHSKNSLPALVNNNYPMVNYAQKKNLSQNDCFNKSSSFHSSVSDYRLKQMRSTNRSLTKQSPLTKPKKTSRSCSFCFSGLNTKYECRCQIGRDAMPQAAKYLNNNIRENSNNSNQGVVVYFGKNCNKTAQNNNNNRSHILQANRGNSLFKSTESSSSKINFTIVISLVTLAFFCCQLPIRIFILWSYAKPPMEIIDEHATVKNEIQLINIISYLTRFIYFLHCISNPIIYNILSIKFRRAFLSLGTSKKTCIFISYLRPPATAK